MIGQLVRECYMNIHIHGSQLRLVRELVFTPLPHLYSHPLPHLYSHPYLIYIHTPTSFVFTPPTSYVFTHPTSLYSHPPASFVKPVCICVRRVIVVLNKRQFD